MIPAVNLGPFVLPTAAFIYIIGAWLCLSLAERVANWLNQDPDKLSGLVSTGLIAGIVAARLTFVATYWSSYQDNLLGIIWPINSGFNPFAGLFFGLMAMFFYGRYKQLPLWTTLDALAPILILALIIVSLADFLGGPGFGTATDLPWGISQFDIRRHPVQLYEIGIGLIALLSWWYYHNRRLFDGQLFLIATAVYCIGRLFVDAFRANAWISTGGWHVLQILFLLIALACLILLAIGSRPYIEAKG
ncbi:MAG: prolipoprotein diacylglyceryl transferase [Candidatus Promineifilaceae bacterium]|nr:prolipoprotein diacylglyceryl transferase [Candidatus Promineifilaceae bacterium]